MTKENLCLLKMTDRHNLYFGLYILLVQTYNDLYRVGMSPNLCPQCNKANSRKRTGPLFAHVPHHVSQQGRRYRLMTVGALAQRQGERR